MDEVIGRALNTTPKDATPRSNRLMAATTRQSHTTIRRIGNAFGLQPHRSETVNFSPDRLFIDKVQDIDLLHLATELGYRLMRRRRFSESGIEPKTTGLIDGTERC